MIVTADWRERIAWYRADIERRLERAVTRTAERVLLGQMPSLTDEYQIRLLRSRLAILSSAVVAAERIETEEGAPW